MPHMSSTAAYLPFRPACSSSTAVYRSVLYLSPASLLVLLFLHFSPSALRQLPATMQFCLLVFYCRLSTVLLAHILPLLAVTRSVLPVPLLVLPVYLTNKPIPLLVLPFYLTILPTPLWCCLSTSQTCPFLFCSCLSISQSCLLPFCAACPPHRYHYSSFWCWLSTSQTCPFLF